MTVAVSSNGAENASLSEEKAGLILDLRRAGVNDMDVLHAIEEVPRELFVPETFRRHAYDNSALPIARGQTISQPLVVGMMTEALKLNRRCKVLEIGTGSGYQAVVLSLLARRVYTVERYRSLLKSAEALFRKLDRHNIVTRFDDGSKGWPEQAPFDRIMVTAASEDVPDALCDQLKEDGILVIPVGGGESLYQSLLRIERTGTGFREENLCEVRFVPLLPGTVSEDE